MPRYQGIVGGGWITVTAGYMVVVNGCEKGMKKRGEKKCRNAEMQKGKKERNHVFGPGFGYQRICSRKVVNQS